MCWCRPELRTPNCGRKECLPPKKNDDLKNLKSTAFKVFTVENGYIVTYSDYFNNNGSAYTIGKDLFVFSNRKDLANFIENNIKESL